MTLACAACALLAAAGCEDSDDGSAAETAGEGPLIVATTGIWADVVSNVACGGIARVQALVASGADPHAFEPSLADRGTLESSALVVANGLGLEESLEDTIDAVADGGTPVFRVGDNVTGVIEGDPHVWLDPSRVVGALPALVDALVQDAGLERAAVEACAREYADELAEIDAEIATTLSGIAPGDRVLVTNHDALAYFADRYDLRVLGTVIPAPSTLAQTSPGRQEELATAVERAGVRAIFAEDQYSDADVRALAERVGDVEVVTLFTGSLGEPGSGAETYLGLLRADAKLIADGLA